MTPESFTWSRHPRVRHKAVRPRARAFDYGFTAKRPLVPLSAVMLYLNLDQAGVMELVESGKLQWAFDIRREESGIREVRVLRESMFEYTGLLPQSAETGEPREDESNRVMEEIVPPGTILRPGETPGRRPGWPASMRLRTGRWRCHAPSLASRQLLTLEPMLSAIEIAQFLSCSPRHVGNLIREKSLVEAKFRRSPKVSPLVLRSGVMEFLRTRRIF